jgi:hypothetical protein
MNYLKQLILMLFKLCIFTRRKNITNGRQLLGRFFFCARSTVIGRPIGTGTLLAEKLDIALPMWMCFFGEGYANFGYFECFFFSCNNFNAFMDHQYACGKMSI